MNNSKVRCALYFRSANPGAEGRSPTEEQMRVVQILNNLDQKPIQIEFLGGPRCCVAVYEIEGTQFQAQAALFAVLERVGEHMRELGLGEQRSKVPTADGQDAFDELFGLKKREKKRS